jgi:diguanylate cyclase (GGDEF)-like protein
MSAPAIAALRAAQEVPGRDDDAGVSAFHAADGPTQAELSRLAALHTLKVLDQPRSHQLDTLARLAAFVCGTPTAAVNLIDADRQVALVLQLRDDAARLGHAATRHHLTGLPNRALFEHVLALALAKHKRGSAAPTVLFLDLDRFKAVNDTHGHAVGDELLRVVALRLLETVRATDLLARLSGDELVILAESADGAGLDALLARLRDVFAPPFELSCGPLPVSASLGHATAVPDDTPASLLARADAAMYQAKRSGAPLP